MRICPRIDAKNCDHTAVCWAEHLQNRAHLPGSTGVWMVTLLYNSGSSQYAELQTMGGGRFP